MIRRFILASILVLLTFYLSAQYKPILLGLKVGGSVDWMKPDADNYSSEGIKPGFSWGFVADFFLMENYVIQTGFNVQYLQGKLKYPALQATADDTISGFLTRSYNLQYIQIPAVLRLQADLSDKIKFFGKLGLGTAFRLRSKAEDEFVGENGVRSSSKKDISEDITLIRESLIIGGGAIFALKGSSALTIDLTFDNGFTNVLTGNNQAFPSVKQKATLNLVELGLGIVF